MMPDQVVARPWSTVLGQFAGLAAGFAGVYAVGAELVPPMMSGHALVWARVGAVGVAIVLAVIFQHLLQAKNPAGGVTALLVALGAEAPTWHGVLVIAVGIILVSTLGEIARFGILSARHSAAEKAASPAE